MICILIIGIPTFLYLFSHPKGSVKNPIPSPQVPTQSIMPTSETSTTPPIEKNNSPTLVTNSSQIATIASQIKPQIAPYVGVSSYNVDKIKIYGNGWAIMRISNPSTDQANVIIEYINGRWKAIAGPTTYFPVSRLQSLHVPQVVIDDANTNLSQ